MSRSPAVQQIAFLLERRGLLGAARAPRRVPTGLGELDALLGGGWPAGRLTQLCGARSSGRTALALASAAALTREGGVVALVDGDDTLDPRQAERAGLVLERTLWLRPRSAGEALRSAEIVIAAGGFGLVVLDLPKKGTFYFFEKTPFLRLAHCAEKTGTPLLLLSQQAGPFAFATVQVERTRVRWDGRAVTEASVRRHIGPRVLTGLKARASLLRSRDQAPGAPVEIEWSA